MQRIALQLLIKVLCIPSSPDILLATQAPVAYMFTTDHSMSQVTQFLRFLRDHVGLTQTKLKKIIIDVSSGEQAAINEVYPNVNAQWCLFNVARAWMGKIRDLISLGSTHSNAAVHRNMHLQWSNSAPTERGSARPDAAIYHKQQGSFVGSRGYGEAKPEGTSTHDISVDFLRVAVFYKNSIDVSLLDSNLAFQINSKFYRLLFILLDFTITFYLQQLTARGIYASFEIARITFPRSLEGIPAFFNLRNIRLLLAVNKVFWHKRVVSDMPATIAQRYCQTIPNWQKNIRTQQDSQRTPSLRIEQ